jgi:hypothetical protein
VPGPQRRRVIGGGPAQRNLIPPITRAWWPASSNGTRSRAT